ncbi:MAG TPA: CvpA family protein [Terriglobales bacterium]|nr:CvpA family protein [Terriglobales bacterium]
MNAADWVIVFVLLVSVLQAASAGFFQEAFGIGGLIFGYLLAAWQYWRLADRFAPYLKSPWLGEIAGFLLIFIGVMFLAGIAGRIARWVAKEAGLSFFDRILGGALGLLRGCLVVAIVLVSMAAFTPGSRWLAESEMAPYFLVVGRAAIWLAPAGLRARFYQGLDLLRGAQHSPENGGAGPAAAAPK